MLYGRDNEIALGADKRQPGSTGPFRSAVDEALGKLDVLDKLDMRIKVEGRRENPVKRARFSVTIFSAEVEELDTFDGPDIRHAGNAPSIFWACPKQLASGN